MYYYFCSKDLFWFDLIWFDFPKSYPIPNGRVGWEVGVIIIIYNLTSILHDSMGETDLLDRKFPIYSSEPHHTVYSILYDSLITSSQIFHGVPLLLCPLQQSPYTSLPDCLCPFFQHVQTTLVYPFVCSFLSNPGYHMSFLSNIAMPSSFTAQVSLPKRTTLLTHAWKFYLLCTVKTPWK